MLKLFRRIRKSLIYGGSLKKYLLYATGEIFLVVIGILIALQINNWNEERKLDLEKNRIYENLLSEFESCKVTWADRKGHLGETLSATNKIVAITGKDQEKISIRAFDSLLVFAVNRPYFNPPFTVYAEIMQTDKINLVDKPEIKSLLYLFESTFQAYKSQEILVINSWEERLMPYLNEKIAFKNIDQFSTINNNVQPSELLLDNRAVLTELQFENLINNHLYGLKVTENIMMELGQIIEELTLALKKVRE